MIIHHRNNTYSVHVSRDISRSEVSVKVTRQPTVNREGGTQWRTLKDGPTRRDVLALAVNVREQQC